MSVIIDGTKGTTTPGLYSNSTFTGTYADGIVADYTTGLGRISVGASDGVAFYNGGVATTELMRIDSSGNLLVGTTSNDAARFRVRGSGATSATYSVKISNSADSIGLQLRDDGYFGSPFIYAKTSGSAANVFVDADGTCWRSTSSLKYKEDVQDATFGLQNVLSLRSVTYKQKSTDSNGAAIDQRFGGLIAEEVHEAGLTEFVQYAPDGTPDALHYGNMVSLCIKAIQEQQAIIEQLKADVAALKAA